MNQSEHDNEEALDIANEQNCPHRPNKLASWVKRILDIAWFVSIGSLIIWPIAILLIGYSIPKDAVDRHTDINFYLNFTVYPDDSLPVLAYDKTKNLSNVSELVKGQGYLKLNNTKSLSAWYYAGAITEITGLIGLFGLWYLRKIFALLAVGDSFNEQTPYYLKKVGYIAIASNIVWSILQYLGGVAIIHDVGEVASFIHLSPAIEPNLGGIFIGVAILVLAGILEEATQIHEEQALTI
jgi:hypothetical protein